MKTISVAVSSADYEAFRLAAESRHRSIASLIREAMATYRVERLEVRPRFEDLPLFEGHRQIGPLPSRSELYDEMLGLDEPEE